MEACWGRRPIIQKKKWVERFASFSQGQREVCNMKTELQRVGLPPDLSHDNGTEDAYLEDLLAFALSVLRLFGTGVSSGDGVAEAPTPLETAIYVLEKTARRTRKSDTRQR